MALPVAAGQRAPAADRRPGGGQRRAPTTATGSTSRRPGTRSCRSSSARPPTGSDTAWSAPPTGPTSPAAPATAPAPTADPFFALVFDQQRAELLGPVTYDRDDLLGGYPAARRYIGWQTFFDLGDGQVKNNKKIDTTISSVLFTLPLPAIAPHTQTSPTVLPQRNLLRQLTWGLPRDRRSRARWASPALEPGRPLGHRGGIRPVRHQHAALVLHPGRSQGGRGRTEPRTGRRTDRHRDADRPAPRRPNQLPERLSQVPAVPRHRPELGSQADPNIAGNRTYTRAHFLHYAGVLDNGIYR